MHAHGKSLNKLYRLLQRNCTLRHTVTQINNNTYTQFDSCIYLHCDTYTNFGKTVRHTQKHTMTHTRTYTHTHTHIYTHTIEHVYTHTMKRTMKHTHTNTHAYTHTHTHTQNR